jgi:hypothetical protein
MGGINYAAHVSLSKKSSESWAFSHKYGKIEAGDEDDYKA